MEEQKPNNQETQAAPQAPPPEEKLKECERERDEYLAGWQRAKADFLNYKKEEFQRLNEVARYATEDVMKDLIVVLDNFDLGIAAFEKKGEVEKGIYMIRTQIEDVLKKRGLERIPVKTGDPFDPAIHEAVAEVEGGGPPEAIVQEIETGYRLYGKVIRPARVKVSKGKQ